MKQTAFQMLGPVCDPVAVTDELVTMCHDEAAAVRMSLQIARKRYGLTQRDVALRCGWRSSSYLSEIASGTGKCMPEKRVRFFVYATGCRLLEQWIERHKAEHARDGTMTRREREEAAVDAYLTRAA